MAESKPNIVYILADDMGYGDPSCYNSSSRIRMPNLDALAATGMRFTDAHSPSAVCTPTRYGILTGRYCWRSRLKQGVLNGFSEHLIEDGRMTVASLLQENGYRTACIGKWHLGWDWQQRDMLGEMPDPAHSVNFTKPIQHGPTSVGFDWYYGIPASLDMPPYCYVENDLPTAVPDGVIETNPWDAYWQEGPIADNFRHIDVLPHLTDRAVEYIQQSGSHNTTQPFFLYFSLPAPHVPIVPAEEFQGKSGAGAYGDFCEQVDFVVGRVLEALDEIGAAENTLLIYTSDNGPEHIAYGRAQTYRHYSMGQLRGVKRDLWEGGHRVPFIARWPERIQAGTVSQAIIALTDLIATIADMMGSKLPHDAGEDSLSMLPVLLGEEMDTLRRQAIVYHSARGNFAIRRNNWVLIDAPAGCNSDNEPDWFRAERGYTTHDTPGELFDLNADPAESKNLYEKHPEIVQELKTLLEKYKREGRSVQRDG